MDLQPRPAYAGGDPATSDARRLVRARLAAKRRRARRIRQTVLAFSVAVFVAMFATIYVRLASGNDPGLSASSKKAAVSSTTSASGSSESSSSNGTSNNSASTGSSEASSSEASSTPSTVTTSQS
jgi:cytoskeletal protein RodZ